VGVDWTDEERDVVEGGIAKHGLHTGRCAALARIVYSVAKPRDPYAHGVYVQPQAGAVWLVPKANSRIPYWGSHTYVETQEHAVDAIVGADGYPAGQFVRDHWEFADSMRISAVDPATVDVGIQDVDGK
jgi:hypothetical protein